VLLFLKDPDTTSRTCSSLVSQTLTALSMPELVNSPVSCVYHCTRSTLYWCPPAIVLWHAHVSQHHIPIRIDRYTVTMFPLLKQNVSKNRTGKYKMTFPLRIYQISRGARIPLFPTVSPPVPHTAPPVLGLAKMALPTAQPRSYWTGMTSYLSTVHRGSIRSLLGPWRSYIAILESAPPEIRLQRCAPHGS
jgi:hypothetical protein